MRRTIVCVCIFTALLQIAACDIDCFLEKDLENIAKLRPALVHVLNFDLQLCRPLREYLEETKKAANECKLKRIHVTKGLAFTKDICTVGWDLNNRYLAEQTCFAQQLMNIQECAKGFENVTRPSWSSYAEADDTTTISPTAGWKSALKEVCKALEGAYKCFVEKIGKPCKENGTALTEELTTALSSYTTGLCLEVNGAMTVTVLSWNLLLIIFIVVLNWHKT